MKKYISLVTTVIIISMISVIFFQLPSGAASPVNTAMTVDPEAGSSALQASEASLTLSRRASSPDADTELRGLWVATVLSLDYPSLPCTDSDALKNDALEILDYAADTGFNAIFLQVRPASDAIYKSAIYPWSKYLTGTQGQAPDNGFDPLQFWVTEAHKRGIELHAWINPYRITKKTSSEPAQSLSSLSPSNPAVKNPSWVVKYSDGNLYFNPGIPGVTKLIVDSVNELLNNYAIDGIHMDDYFYPGKDFNDSDTFKKYGTGYKSLEEWRLSNVDAMVSEVSKAVRSFGISPTATSAGTEQSSADRDLKFGISPFGIWANKSDNALGSATSGFQSYYSYYADSRKWVKEGLVDYIAPQIYWSMGFPTADYKTLVQWWKDVASGTGVKLYIGLAAYRSGDSEQSSPWYGITEIIRQLSFNEATTGVDGSIFFRYKAIKQIPALSPAIKTHFISHDEGAAVIPATIGRPLENIRTGYSSYYISGTSDPAKPLYLNGTRLEGRSASGYYGVLVKLNEGSNTFTVSQDASFASKVIYRTSSASSKMSKAEIVSSSVFPQTQEFRMPGETVTLACRAPSGAKLTVKINGKSLQMKQSSGASTSGSGSGIYSASFTCSYTMPSFTGTARNVNLGAPVYTMKYGGKTKTLKAPAKIGVIMKSSPYYAMVNQETAIAYKSASTSNGSGYELSKGMSDYITGMTGGFVRLSSGIWLKASTVTAYTSKKQFKPAITAISYVGGSRWDELKLSVENSTAITTKAVAAVCTRADFDGSVLKLTLASVSTDKAAPVAALPESSPFSGMTVERSGNKAVYSLSLKDGESCDGYYVERVSDGIVLHIKRHISNTPSIYEAAATGSSGRPLSGITIMVDPGHGGSESGAIGPTGMVYPEKTINLATALKLKDELENLGASVLMTRTTDTTVSLNERLAASRKAKPDLFISIHANSMEDNIDISKYKGFSSYFREDLSKQLATLVYDNVTASLGRYKNGVHDNNFFVITATWTPSILIESGFVPNPSEHEWLINKESQALLAKSLAKSIAAYFN